MVILYQSCNFDKYFNLHKEHAMNLKALVTLVLIINGLFFPCQIAQATKNEFSLQIDKNVKTSSLLGLPNYTLLAEKCAPNINIVTLTALIQHESKGNIFAIGVNNKKYRLKKQPTSYMEAINLAKWLYYKKLNFDAGLGQINSSNYKHLGLNIIEIFDPCKNLQATQSILTDCFVRAKIKYVDDQQALRAALSCYNTNNFYKGFRNGYVQKVVSNVGVIIPALEPFDDEKQQNRLLHYKNKNPIRLQASTKKEFPINDKKSLKDDKEVPDAFNTTFTDAFGVVDN